MTTNLTEEYLAALCARTFMDRPRQQIVEIRPLNSRQHEMLSFELWWYTDDGITDYEKLIARRYVSTLSWWRPDDRGKAQRETTVVRWLNEQDFPVPKVYAREFGPFGDVVLFSHVRNQNLFTGSIPLSEAITPYIAPLAEALADLHNLTPSDAVRRVVPWVTLPGALANLTALAVQVKSAELVQAAELAMAHAYDVQELEPVLIHGDYHFLNAMLYDGKITGVIDWEYCALGDPRWDVANVYAQLVDFGAADAADQFLQVYLDRSGGTFEGPPLYNVVAPLQQWAISEWVLTRFKDGNAPSFGLEEDLIELRDVHRRRAKNALTLLDN